MLSSGEGEKIKKLLSIDGKTQRGNGNLTQKANHIAILLLVVGVFDKTLRVLRLRAANPTTINWKIAIS